MSGRLSDTLNSSWQGEKVLVLDFGSQYTQLLARRVREQNVYSEIVRFDISPAELLARSPSGLILSGGPASVYWKGAPMCGRAVLELGIPVLGVCYGMQLMAKLLGGKTGRASSREYGSAPISVLGDSGLFRGIDGKFNCWMSHGDYVSGLPPGFRRIATTSNSPIAAMADIDRKLYGVQFHPEVVHTQNGPRIMRNFLYRVCGCKGDWTVSSFLREQARRIKSTVGGGKAVCALSGGVDSSVAAAIVARAIGRRLHCVFVDNGLLRKDEAQEVCGHFSKRKDMNFRFVDARRRFLRKLAGVVDPEKKRKIIGNEFIRVFEQEARRIKNAGFLVQGTLYPDVIESRSAFGGPSARIKTHHNVGGLPEKMHLKLIEPLKELFKDEVRVLGRKLRLPASRLLRHPFPGPGLAVRVIGDITEERLEILREADAKFIEEIRGAGLYHDIWQAFCVLLPVKSVGVMGDERTYENVIAVRAVTSLDGMTADWARIPENVLARISNRIINETRGVNRVVYDVSSKPPATIEWE